MIRIVATWDLWAEVEEEVDLWHFMARAFAVDEIVMSPGTDLDHRAVREMGSQAEAVRQARDDGLSIAFFDERGDVDLWDFEHSVDQAYVFGGASRNANIEKVSGDVTVRIETPGIKGLLWGHQAAAIALYSRGMQTIWR